MSAMGGTMGEWTAEVAALLQVTDAVDEKAATDAILDMSRDVAHQVARPAAPFTAFLVGLAAGRASDPVTALPEIAAAVSARAQQFAESRGEAPQED